MANRETAQIAGSASPRKPRVAMAARSSSAAILDVAWRASASSASAPVMPVPSSATEIRAAPPSRSSTVTVPASASSAFSTSSFTAAAGRSTTSPAAILLTRCSGRTRIRVMAVRARARTDRGVSAPAVADPRMAAPSGSRATRPARASAS